MHAVLIASGVGYIGLHMLAELIDVGYQCVVIDRLSNSSRMLLDRAECIVGIVSVFYDADVYDCADFRRWQSANLEGCFEHVCGGAC